MTRNRTRDVVDDVNAVWRVGANAIELLGILIGLMIVFALGWALVEFAKTETAAFVWAMIIAVVYIPLKHVWKKLG